MELDIKQKNELLTGIVLAQELTALTEDTRRFMVVKSFDIADGHIKPWSKTLPNTLDNIKAKFVDDFSELIPQWNVGNPIE